MLKKILLVAFGFLFGLGNLESWAVAPINPPALGSAGYYLQPTIAGDKIVFVCEDDLWSVSANGGVASRLTTGRGACSSPKLSPDGRQIAFVGREDGDEEVYAMPCAGGALKRLTFLGGHKCFVSGWSPDSTKILFSSDAGTDFSGLMQAFSIGPEGGEAVPLHYGPVQTMAFNAVGARLLGRNSFDPASWKRYRGGQDGELWIDGAGSGDFKPLIKLPGNMVNPMWVRDRIYFLSDHEGVGNIYSCTVAGEDLRRHTNHLDYYVRFPASDGKKIVYTAGAQLYVFDPEKNVELSLPVEAPSSSTQLERKFVSGGSSLQAYAVDAKGRDFAVIARGQPFTLGLTESAVIGHGVGSRVRYSLPGWLADGKRFVVVNDKDGYQRVELHYADHSRDPEMIGRTDIGTMRELVVSPRADVVALTNHKNELWLLDLQDKSMKMIDRSDHGLIGHPAWSSDGQWLAYSWAPSTEQSIIRVVNPKLGQVHDLTSALRSDYCPTFDPDGKFLYFLSNRDFLPVPDGTDLNYGFPFATRPYLITLRANQLSPLANELGTAKELGTGKELGRSKALGPSNKTAATQPVAMRVDENKDGGASAPQSAATRIDFEAVQDRLIALPVQPGHYAQIVAVKGRCLYTQVPFHATQMAASFAVDGNGGALLKTYDFEEKKEIVLQDSVQNMILAGDQKTLVCRSRGSLVVIDASRKLGPLRRLGVLNPNRIKVSVEPIAEWQQMFDEAWRLQAQHFWQEDMCDVDWKLVHKRYSALLPRVRTRRELSDLIHEMQGELGTSHTYEHGGDNRLLPAYHRGFLGADLSYDQSVGGDRIDKIYHGDSWMRQLSSPLSAPGVSVHEGDVIVAVGGQKVDKNRSVESLLIDSNNTPVQLTILANGKSDSDHVKKQIVVRTLPDEHALRYRDWVESNRRFVHQQSHDQIGYIHIPDMKANGLAEFNRGFLTEYKYPALIVDVRHNTGGNVSPLILEKLNRKRVAYTISRWEKPEPIPLESVAGPLVALTDQFTSSDGDIFTQCFKLYNLGPTVGKRTWGGVVGMRPRDFLVDGTVTSQPEFAHWFGDVGWNVENRGCDPDCQVEITPTDFHEGRDPQLAKAIDLMKESLAAKPVSMPKFGPRPSRALPVRLGPPSQESVVQMRLKMDSQIVGSR